MAVVIHSACGASRCWVEAAPTLLTETLPEYNIAMLPGTRADKLSDGLQGCQCRITIQRCARDPLLTRIPTRCVRSIMKYRTANTVQCNSEEIFHFVIWIPFAILRFVRSGFKCSVATGYHACLVYARSRDRFGAVAEFIWPSGESLRSTTRANTLQGRPAACLTMFHCVGASDAGGKGAHWAERQRVRADGREQDGRHVGVHHGAARCHAVRRATRWGGQHHAIRLHLGSQQAACNSGTAQHPCGTAPPLPRVLVR